MDRLIVKLDGYAVAHLSEFGYSPTSPLADRHGSWMRHMAKAGDTPQRVISQAFTPLGEADAIRRYEVEIAAGAQSGNRFSREVIETFEIPDSEQDRRRLVNALDKAVRFAAQLTNEDLSSSFEYPDKPRSHRAGTVS